MDPFTQNIQIEEIMNDDYEDLFNDPLFYDDVYDDASFGLSQDVSNDF